MDDPAIDALITDLEDLRRRVYAAERRLKAYSEAIRVAVSSGQILLNGVATPDLNIDLAAISETDWRTVIAWGGLRVAAATAYHHRGDDADLGDMMREFLAQSGENAHPDILRSATQRMEHIIQLDGVRQRERGS